MTESEAFTEFRKGPLAEKIWALIDVTPATLAVVEAAFSSGYGAGKLEGLEDGFSAARDVITRTVAV